MGRGRRRDRFDRSLERVEACKLEIRGAPLQHLHRLEIVPFQFLDQVPDGVVFHLRLIEQVQGIASVRDFVREHPNFDLNALRMVLYAATLIGLMVLRPSGVFGESEIWKPKRKAKAGPSAAPKAASPPRLIHPPPVGLIVISTPMRPITTAVHRRHPTRSPKIGTDSAVIDSGADMKIA